jgi:hypothetical protein
MCVCVCVRMRVCVCMCVCVCACMADDETDYFSSESNHWLTPAQRAALKEKEAAIATAREDARRTQRVTIDVAGRRVLTADDARTQGPGTQTCTHRKCMHTQTHTCKYTQRHRHTHRHTGNATSLSLSLSLSLLPPHARTHVIATQRPSCGRRTRPSWPSSTWPRMRGRPPHPRPPC